MGKAISQLTAKALCCMRAGVESQNFCSPARPERGINSLVLRLRPWGKIRDMELRDREARVMCQLFEFWSSRRPEGLSTSNMNLATDLRRRGRRKSSSSPRFFLQAIIQEAKFARLFLTHSSYPKKGKKKKRYVTRVFEEFLLPI